MTEHEDALAQSLGEALPSEFVTVDRDRSVSDRMRGRPGEISPIAVQLGDQQITLSARNGQAVAEGGRAGTAVVLSRQTTPIHEWAAALAAGLVAYAEQNAQ